MNAGLRGFFVVKTLTGPSPHARKLLTALLAPHRRHPFQHRESGRPVGERAITCSQVLGSGWEGDTRKVNIYADFTVYKGRGAMTIKLIKPTWERVPTGSGLKVARDGTLLLEFAASRGEREYDWDSKETFALNAVECGEVIEAVDSSVEKQFFHDPNKMASGEGSISKTLRITPARDSGFFFSLSVNNKISGNNTRLDTVVSPAEARVIRSVIDFAIPRLLGFDEMFAGAPEIRENIPSAPLGPGPTSEPPF